MGQILHGSATTTEAVRRAIQNSQASLRQLAVRYGINPKTVAKWRRRSSVCDARMGPSEPRSTVLSNQEEALVVAFRKHTLLPLDDCLYALQATVPHLTRSSLHRCFQRHGISRLPETQGDKPARKKFKSYPIGYFHIDIAEVRTEQGKLYLFVAIDRTSKFAYAELHEKANRWIATDFLKALIKAVPYKIHTVLTDNGIQFTDLPKNRLGPTARWRTHMFDMLCDANSIEHRLTKPNHPWTNGQVERMNRTLKEATVQRYHYGTHAQLKAHLHAFLMAYNFAKRLKTLKGLTPYEHICKVWTTQPNRFRLDPLHHTVGLNTYASVLAHLGRRKEARETLLTLRPGSDQTTLENLPFAFPIKEWEGKSKRFGERLFDGFRIAGLPLDVTVPKLIDELKGDDPFARQLAMKRLGWFGAAAAEAVPVLVHARR
jgi:transposase-like protein